MLDPTVETWYIWTGLAVASVVTLAVATALPHAPPPDAASVAESVDSVTASDHPVTTVHPLDADAIRVGPYRIWLRDDGATGHATLTYGPITPVRPDTALWRVLQGTPPDHAFDSPMDVQRAVATARERDPAWRTVDDVTIRRIEWEGANVTLVG